jgi:ABC-type phosphate transport system auxiliary subunit
MPPNDVRPKLDALVSRYRGLSAYAAPREVEELYTHGCAEMLRLETKVLRLKRRLAAAEADSADDPVAARQAAELRRKRDQVDEELAAIRALVRLLRTALDWTDAPARSETWAGSGSQAAGAAQ